MSIIQFSPTDKNKISTCKFDNVAQLKFIKKSNFFIDLEALKPDNIDNVNSNLKPLTKMEIMIIQTAFFMAHELNVSIPTKTYDAETDFIISFDKFAEMWRMGKDEGTSDKSFNTTIRRAIQKIDKRRFYYRPLDSDSDNDVMILSGYFASIKFVVTKGKGSELSFNFPKDFIPYLKSYGQFTWYYFENSIKLCTNPNAAILYEQFCKSKNSNIRVSKNEINVNLDLQKIRKLFTLSEDYKTADLFRRVLDPAIDFINANTTIVVTEIDRIKRGKNIIEAVYRVEFDENDLNLEAAFMHAKKGLPLMTNLQIQKYADALVNMPEFFIANKNSDEEKHHLYARLLSELQNNDFVLKYYYFLDKAGYKSKKTELAYITQKGGSV